MNLEKHRKDFPILNLKKNKIIYFDNAASSLKPKQVIKAINNYYNDYPANVHRGIHRLSMQASIVYEKAHEDIASFFNCKKEEVIFTQNSTDAINLIMYSLYNSNYFKKGDEIITSIEEHHANFVPWQFLAKKLKLKLKFIKLTKDQKLDVLDLKKIITSKTKLVAIAHISNTLGVINLISEIIKIAHSKKSLVLVDGSQSAPHLKIDFERLDCDFFVATAHKMLGPTGIGCVIGKEKLLNKFEPFRFGGDIISNVTLKESKWNSLPYKFEAGTPNISGVFGFLEAVNYLKKVGVNNIYKHDKEILKYAYEKLKEIKNIIIYNCKDIDNQIGIIIFNLKGIEAIELSALLDEISGVATRAGMHCAQPIIETFDRKGVVRASFYFYNTKKEVDVFVKTLKKIDLMVNK